MIRKHPKRWSALLYLVAVAFVAVGFALIHGIASTLILVGCLLGFPAFVLFCAYMDDD